MGFEEYKAHDNLVALLRSYGFKVTPHAYGIDTSFTAEVGTGGRVVTFNAEYDALAGIGHGCGHNLIATSSLAAFLGVAAALKETGIPGRVRLLGTPAEEGGGGKVFLVKAGAFRDVNACLMAHPGPPNGTSTGAAYNTTVAMGRFNVSYFGKPAHAAGSPYQGINALDGLSLAYTAVSMLRQQTKPTDRIHFIIHEGGEAANIIPDLATGESQVRSTTIAEMRVLKERVKKCHVGAAIATDCKMMTEEYVHALCITRTEHMRLTFPSSIMEFADLRPNKTICSTYADEMLALGSPVDCDFNSVGGGSTDQGWYSSFV